MSEHSERRSKAKLVFFPKPKKESKMIKPKVTELKVCTEIAGGTIYVQCKEDRCKRVLSPESSTKCKKHVAQENRDLARKQAERKTTEKLDQISDIVFATVLNADKSIIVKPKSIESERGSGYEQVWFAAHMRAKETVKENKELWKMNRKKLAQIAENKAKKPTKLEKDVAGGKVLDKFEMQALAMSGGISKVKTLLESKKEDGVPDMGFDYTASKKKGSKDA